MSRVPGQAETRTSRVVLPAPPCFPPAKTPAGPSLRLGHVLAAFAKASLVYSWRIRVAALDSRRRSYPFECTPGTALYEVIHPWCFPRPATRVEEASVHRYPVPSSVRGCWIALGPWRKAAILALTLAPAVRSAARANFRHRCGTCMSPRLEKPRVRLRPAQCTLPIQLPAIGGVDTSWP